MSDEKLAAKKAYFQEQALLDLSDDEEGFPTQSYLAIDRALADSKAMPPPSLTKQTSSFLGPTPKERQTEFETHTTRRREAVRNVKTVRSSTAPEPDVARSFPSVKTRSGLLFKKGEGKRLKRVSSLPNLDGQNQVPFYKQIGVIPRELKNGKNVKPADNITLESVHKQLLKDKVVYFYPNDDISMARRTRIHKVIQLGAAWINRWRDDITHIILDDASYTYNQLLRHLNRAGLPKRVVLVKFDPYVPQCIQFGTLLDPHAQRFAVKGAPQRGQVDKEAEPSQPLASASSHSSLQVKRSRRQLDAESQKTDSHPTEQSSSPALQLLVHEAEERVEDSFIMPSPEENEHAVEQHPDSFGDALSQAIQETKAIAHLPLDEEDDTESPTTSSADQSDESGTDDKLVRMAPKPLQKSFNFLSKASTLRGKRTLNLNAFQCMDPGSNKNSHDLNARTIQILEEMCKHYDQMQDTWRTLAYRKGITTLKKQTMKITSAKQAAALPFIGARLADKIEEIVLTDRLRKLDNTHDDPLDVILRLFLGVYGAGLVQANKWIQAGHRTLDDLQTKAKLTESQKVGIEHYDDFNSRIPREEVAAHGKAVIQALRENDSTCKATVMGSYRRGAKTSGDIDMIITKPGATLATLRNVVFDKLVPQLYKDGFLKASLATSRSKDTTGTKWHGASCVPSSTVWRRMDFLLVPEEEMGAALIYFTGNDIFNRSIRLLARKKNMKLNQRGLYKDVKRGQRGEKLTEGILVEGRDEKKIFELLGVPWREPHERIC